MPKIIDLHCDTVVAIQAGIDIKFENKSTQVSIPCMKKGGIGLQVFACFIASAVPEKHAFIEVLKLINHVHDFAKENDDVVLVASSQEATSVLAGEKTGIMLAVENGHVLQGKIDNLDELYNLGVRYLTLTHAKHLTWAASSGQDWNNDAGLTDLGREIIQRMNSLGMIIDVSHVHENTVRDVLQQSKYPVIASHSNCRSICPTPRNLSDEQIRAIADKGGVIGINFYPGFLDAEYLQYQTANCKDLYNELERVEQKYLTDYRQKFMATLEFFKDLQNRMAKIQVTSDRIVDHIGHIISVAGDDHVAFGSDFDGVPALPTDIPGCDCIPVIIEKMQQRRIPDKSIEKICSENFLRVLRANEEDN
jgi:membrane dipeptidase